MKDNPKIVKTGDDSLTLYSKEYDEEYHSITGALKESFDKYAKPCKIRELAIGGSANVLDICFGLGYNVLSAIYTAKKANTDCKVNILTLEKDIISADVLDSLALPKELESTYGIVKSAAKELRFVKDDIKIEIINGDARLGIKTIEKQFDAVFLDPFSVKKNPELWTVEFFTEIYKRMTDTAILATYSASTPVRYGLLEAGFKIGPGPGDAIKKGGTLATKKGIIPEFSIKVKERLKNSPERIPFHDPDLNFTKEEIFAFRESRAIDIASH